MKTVILKVVVEDENSAQALVDELVKVMEHESGYVADLYVKNATRAQTRAAKRDQG